MFTHRKHKDPAKKKTWKKNLHRKRHSYKKWKSRWRPCGKWLEN